jgi:Ca-activated chloride channel family protein
MSGWRLLLSMTSLAALAATAAAQSPTFSARREAVRVDALVTAAGKPVKGLRPGDFEVRDNGVLQEVELATFEELPLNVILAFDMSASVAGERLAHLQNAGKAVLDALKRDDRSALVTFGYAVTERAPLSSDPSGARRALDESEGAGNTALIDGVYASVLLGEADAGRSLVIVFSDGLDTSSWLTRSMLLETTKRSEVVVYGVSAGGSDAAEILEEVSRSSGGAWFEIETMTGLDAVFLRILDEFRFRYLVSYSPRGVDETGWHRLDVRVKRPGITVKARPGYYK